MFTSDLGSTCGCCGSLISSMTFFSSDSVASFITSPNPKARVAQDKPFDMVTRTALERTPILSKMIASNELDCTCFKKLIWIPLVLCFMLHLVLLDSSNSDFFYLHPCFHNLRQLRLAPRPWPMPGTWNSGMARRHEFGGQKLAGKSRFYTMGFYGLRMGNYGIFTGFLRVPKKQVLA